MLDFVDLDNDMVGTLRDHGHDDAHVHDSDKLTSETSQVNHDNFFHHSPQTESAFATSDLWCDPTSIDPTNDNSDFSDDLQEPHSDDENDDGH